MTNSVDVSTLKSRPPWRLVKILKIFTVILAVISVMAILFGLYFGYVYMSLPISDEVTLKESFYSAVSGALESLGYYGLTIAFFMTLLLLATQAVDRLDQLVWLSASEEDRLYIYHQRIKKEKQ